MQNGTKQMQIKLICNDFKALIEYSNDMNGIYKIIEGYNPNKESKILLISLLICLAIKSAI